ncbi:hypothetical protein TruAng_002713 [Truncatella angustata]|nr:hypothetical protein TruAng_002713 [Truncatella angustata]
MSTETTMSTRTPKSILKKSSGTGKLAADKAAADKARQVAVTHAKIIHQQRDHQDQITDTLMELCKLPLLRESPYTSSNPAPSDAAAFKSGIRLFQPGDYDDLIEERNASGLCGYTLCPSPRRRVQGGEWKIVGANILPKKEVEKWCSQACAKRALYVKVQLNETAPWERAGINSIKIDLYEEPDRNLANDMNNLKLESQPKNVRDTVKNARDLALERGDQNEKGKEPSIPVIVKDKAISTAAEAPSWNEMGDGHLILEGYKTKTGNEAHSN